MAMRTFIPQHLNPKGNVLMSLLDNYSMSNDLRDHLVHDYYNPAVDDLHALDKLKILINGLYVHGVWISDIHHMLVQPEHAGGRLYRLFAESNYMAARLFVNEAVLDGIQTVLAPNNVDEGRGHE